MIGCNIMGTMKTWKQWFQPIMAYMEGGNNFGVPPLGVTAVILCSFRGYQPAWGAQPVIIIATKSRNDTCLTHMSGEGASAFLLKPQWQYGCKLPTLLAQDGPELFVKSSANLLSSRAISTNSRGVSMLLLKLWPLPWRVVTMNIWCLHR